MKQPIAKKRAIAVAAVAAALAIATLIVIRTCGGSSEHDKLGLVGIGGGGLPPGVGGGLAKVNLDSATTNILTGSGTVANPLLARVVIGSGLTGSGTSGNPLVPSLPGGTCSSGNSATALSAGGALSCAANVSAVNAGSGIAASTTTGTATVAVNAGSGLTADGTNVRANLGAGLAFSSGAIAANLTGGTCTLGKAATSVDASGAVTCGNVGRNDPDGTHFEWFDDFIDDPAFTTTGIPVGPIYRTNFSGASAVIGSTNNGTTTRPGITDLVPGTTVNRIAGLMTGTNAIDYGSGNWTWECVLGFPTLSDGTNTYAATMGFGDITTGINHTDGCYFLYDQANVATNGANSGNAHKFECVCGNGTGSPTRTVYLMDGTTTSDESFVTVNAPVAALSLPNTNIYRLKIVMTGTTRAEFYVNGTKSCDINTHISGGGSRLTGSMVQIVASAGASEKLTLDWCRLSVDLTSARSP